MAFANYVNRLLLFQSGWGRTCFRIFSNVCYVSAYPIQWYHSYRSPIEIYW